MTLGEMDKAAEAIVEMVLQTVERTTRRKIVFPAGFVTRGSAAILPVQTAMKVAVHTKLHEIYQAGFKAGRRR